MPARSFRRSGACWAAVIVTLACGTAAFGQGTPSGSQQMLIDIDALVVGTEVTTRCSLFDTSIDYLTPLEQEGAALRLQEITAAASQAFGDLPDRLATMRANAAAMNCGDNELVPYLDFSRQIARDTIDIALVAWRSIDIDQCNYFADDDFLAAADRARSVAGETIVEGEQNRITYIDQRAAAWVEVFASNCANLRFDPVETLPGQIALALPLQ